MAKAAAREAREERVVSARHRATEHKVGFGVSTLNTPAEIPYMQLAEGLLTVEIFPYEVTKAILGYSEDIRKASGVKPGDLYFEQTFFTHRDIGPEAKAVICSRRTFGEKCPICEHRAWLMKDPASDQQAIKDLTPKERQVFCLLNHKELPKGPQLLEVSFHNFGKLLDSRVKNDPEGKDGPRQFFASPGAKGMTLQLTVGMKSMGPGTKLFPEVTAIDFVPRKHALKPEWLKKVPALCELPIKIPYDELRQLFYQDEGGGGADTAAGGDDTPAAAAPADDSGGWGDDAPAEAPAEAKLWTVGERACFTYKDEQFEGEIVAINEGKKLAQVKVEDKPKPAVVSLDDLVMPAEPEAAGDGWGDDAPAADAPADEGWGDTPAAETGAEAGDDWGTDAGTAPAEEPAAEPAAEAGDGWGDDPEPAKTNPAKAPPKQPAKAPAKAPPGKTPAKAPAKPPVKAPAAKK